MLALQLALVVILGGILIGANGAGSEEAVTVARTSDYEVVATLDEVSSADIAATIARGTSMLVADNVQNMADSLEAQVDFATSEESYLAKPQIVATDAKSIDDIQEYKVQKGESIDDIARRFNITSDTVRWANNIQGNVVSEGRELTIPPITGLIYTVKSGDTAASIAKVYKSNAAQIIAFNDAEIKDLKKGQKIIIPGGEKPAPVEPAQAPVYVAAGPSAPTSTAFSFGTQPLYGGNGYSYGYCTWHVANRRLALGLPMPRNLGNAVTWAALGGIAGLDVSGVPKSGSILWHKNTYLAGGLGHVGFVEAVNGDGSITVSDMNYPSWGVATTRTVPAAEISGYLFIY